VQHGVNQAHTKDNSARKTVMKPNRSGFTLIELLIVIVLIGILAVIAQAYLWNAKDRALITNMQHDLKVLATQQEVYFARSLSYADDMIQLTDYTPSTGVQIQITYAQTDGWAATATHTSIAGVQCGVFHGNATAADAPPADRHGVVRCDN
jgi:prepilin-type N-terminal cleavage/methylation domain-containing protein